MTNLPVIPGSTLVAVLVDRSGSMATAHDEMESGLNDFIRDQAALPGDAALMLGQFDNQYEVVWPIQPIKGAPHYSLKPRGGTALLDGIGMFIGDVNETLAQENTYRPVVMCIVTDGAENASKEWDLESVQAWIAHQREVYGWQFVFLGANLDAVKTAAKFGIPTNSALTFNTSRGKASYQLLHEYVAKVRSGRKAEFTPDDRQKAIGQ